MDDDERKHIRALCARARREDWLGLEGPHGERKLAFGDEDLAALYGALLGRLAQLAEDDREAKRRAAIAAMTPGLRLEEYGRQVAEERGFDLVLEERGDEPKRIERALELALRAPGVTHIVTHLGRFPLPEPRARNARGWVRTKAAVLQVLDEARGHRPGAVKQVLYRGKKR